MPPSLSSMTSTCLQQRDGYPYMFTDPLHSLGNPYNAHSARSTPIASIAHQQQSSHYSTNSTNSTSTGEFNFFFQNLNLLLNLKNKEMIVQKY